MGFRSLLRGLMALLEAIPQTDGFDALVSALKSDLTHSLAYSAPDTTEWRNLCNRIEEQFQKTTHNESRWTISAYYTPRPVADFICKLVISSYLENKLKKMNLAVKAKDGYFLGLKKEFCEKILEEVLFDLKILDNSAGLGEFLIAAMEYLLPFYEQLLLTMDDGSLSKDSAMLRKAAKSLIIEKNLYGVEICPASVSLSNIRLWFMQNQNALPENLEEPLNLSRNIKQANTLLVAWNELFPSIIRDSQGFDVIIGNPPYTKLDQVPHYKDSLKADHDIYYNQGDLTHHFILRSLQLLKPGGILGYIIARYLLEAKKADKIRNYLRENSTLDFLLDLGPVRVFGPVNTRSLILVATNSLLKNGDNPLLCGNVRNWNTSLQDLFQTLEDLIIREKSQEKEGISIFSLKQNSSAFTGSRWILVPQELLRIMIKIRKYSRPLSYFCKVGKGMESGFNKAYTVSPDDSQDLEEDVLRRRPQTKDIRRFLIRDSSSFFIFPEIVDNPANYPATIAHLQKFKTRLDSRYKHPRRWFDYSAPQNKELFMKNEKILVPYTSVSNRFALDTQNRIGMTDVYCIAMKNDPKGKNSQNNGLNIRWVLGILNSRVAEFFYLTFIAKRKKGEFEYLTSMGEIPIPTLDLTDPRDKKSHDLTVNAVEKISHLMKEIDKRTVSDNEVAELKMKVFNLEKQIDSLVYEQYALNAADREIINSYFKCNDPDTYFQLLDRFEPRMNI